EVGQGLVTVQAQIAGTELGVNDVVVLDADTNVGSAGSSSASRQTYITGGAVKAACDAVRERVIAMARAELRAPSGLHLENENVCTGTGRLVAPRATLVGDGGSDG